jgi:hypothetical protein
MEAKVRTENLALWPEKEYFIVGAKETVAAEKTMAIKKEAKYFALEQ